MRRPWPTTSSHRGDLDADARAGVEAIVALHVKKHGDVEQSLAAVPSNRSTRASLAALGEPEIEATLARVARSKNGPATDAEDDDPDRTGTYSGRLGHLRRPAVPHPAAACAGRPGGRLRGARRRVAPRGGAEADPRQARRRPGQPAAVRRRGRDHRRAGAPGRRPRLRPGHGCRRPSLLRDAVHQG